VLGHNRNGAGSWQCRVPAELVLMRFTPAPTTRHLATAHRTEISYKDSSLVLAQRLRYPARCLELEPTRKSPQAQVRARVSVSHTAQIQGGLAGSGRPAYHNKAVLLPRTTVRATCYVSTIAIELLGQYAKWRHRGEAAGSWGSPEVRVLTSARETGLSELEHGARAHTQPHGGWRHQVPQHAA
jgi:hypothetical protein